MIRAIVFDCDGLLVDTEASAFESWRRVYDRFGVPLTMAIWEQVIGRGQEARFDLIGHLEDRVGGLDRVGILAERLADHRATIAMLPLLPGVRDRIEECRRLGLKIAAASSSECDYVHTLLASHDLRFDAVACGDEVVRTKPAPDLYLLALERLDVRTTEAIAIEDSPSGALAAQRAGLFCVVVPNSITARLPFGEVDLHVDSLLDLSIATLAVANR